MGCIDFKLSPSQSMRTNVIFNLAFFINQVQNVQFNLRSILGWLSWKSINNHSICSPMYSSLLLHQFEDMLSKVHWSSSANMRTIILLLYDFSEVYNKVLEWCMYVCIYVCVCACVRVCVCGTCQFVKRRMRQVTSKPRVVNELSTRQRKEQETVAKHYGLPVYGTPRVS